MPDEWSRAMRRRLSRRDQLVSARTRAKNEIHAVLIGRRRAARPSRTSSAYVAVSGSRVLSCLTKSARRSPAACAASDFLDVEITALDAAIACEALTKPEVLRLMSVPGVTVITASTFVAAIGDIHRFTSARKLIGYLGLDPKVRQSGVGPARHGRISKQGSAIVRHTLVEAAWAAVCSPGPLRAFSERVRGRRGAQVAAVATARELAHLFWWLLTRQQDYAFAQPSLTPRKIRRLELAAGVPSARGRSLPARGCATNSYARLNARSRCRPRTPTGARSPTGTPPARQERARA
jgi:transposase